FRLANDELGRTSIDRDRSPIVGRKIVPTKIARTRCHADTVVRFSRPHGTLRIDQYPLDIAGRPAPEHSKLPNRGAGQPQLRYFLYSSGIREWYADRNWLQVTCDALGRRVRINCFLDGQSHIEVRLCH